MANNQYQEKPPSHSTCPPKEDIIHKEEVKAREVITHETKPRKSARLAGKSGNLRTAGKSVNSDKPVNSKKITENPEVKPADGVYGERRKNIK